MAAFYVCTRGFATSTTTSSSGNNGNGITMRPITWHGGHDASTDVQRGSCYCNAEAFCLCSPSLAIDVVVLSHDVQHAWLVRRRDTNQLATMGGFVQVGETAEAAVRRELHEEMGITASHQDAPVLFGVYSDPRRDNRRHTVSITYAVRLHADAPRPVAADDVKQVQAIAWHEIEAHSFFADHKTILTDFRRLLQREEEQFKLSSDAGDFAEDIVRSVCRLNDESLSIARS